MTESDGYDLIKEEINKEVIQKLKDIELEEKVKRFLKQQRQYFSTVFYDWNEDEEYVALLAFIKDIIAYERR